MPTQGIRGETHTALPRRARALGTPTVQQQRRSPRSVQPAGGHPAFILFSLALAPLLSPFGLIKGGLHAKLRVFTSAEGNANRALRYFQRHGPCPFLASVRGAVQGTRNLQRWPVSCKASFTSSDVTVRIRKFGYLSNPHLQSARSVAISTGLRGCGLSAE